MTDEELKKLINTSEENIRYSTKHHWINLGILIGFAVSMLSLLTVGGFVFSIVLLDQTFTEIINSNDKQD